MNIIKKDIKLVQTNKDSISQFIVMKNQENMKLITNEMYKIQEELHRFTTTQNQKNNSLQQNIKEIKVEDDQSNNQIYGLSLRIDKLESILGKKEIS